MPSRSINPLMAKIRNLFQRDLALENDYLRQENKILRSKFGARVPLTDADRRILVRFGLKIKNRLRDVASIATPETFLAWNRRMKKEKWRFDTTPKRPGRPRNDPDTEALVVKLAEENLPCRYAIHDRDSTFKAFDPIIRSHGIKVVKTSFRCPICNAFAERHVREIRETLNNLILLGEWHLRHVLKRIEVHHNTRQPHQGIGNVIPVAFDYPEKPSRPEHVHCDSELGGLLNHQPGAKGRLDRVGRKCGSDLRILPAHTLHWHGRVWV